MNVHDLEDFIERCAGSEGLTEDTRILDMEGDDIVFFFSEDGTLRVMKA